jgi:hypothetical protein
MNKSTSQSEVQPHPSELPSPIRARWGDALEDGFFLEDGFLVVPTVLLRKQFALGLSDGALIVLLNLLVSWRRDAELPFTQPATIATRMGDSPRSTQRLIQQLEAKQLVKRVPREDVAPHALRQSVWDLSGTVDALQKLGRQQSRETKQARG